MDLSIPQAGTTSTIQSTDTNLNPIQPEGSKAPLATTKTSPIELASTDDAPLPAPTTLASHSVPRSLRSVSVRASSSRSTSSSRSRGSRSASHSSSSSRGASRAASRAGSVSRTIDADLVSIPGPGLGPAPNPNPGLNTAPVSTVVTSSSSSLRLGSGSGYSSDADGWVSGYEEAYYPALGEEEHANTGMNTNMNAEEANSLEVEELPDLNLGPRSRSSSSSQQQQQQQQSQSSNIIDSSMDDVQPESEPELLSDDGQPVFFLSSSEPASSQGPVVVESVVRRVSPNSRTTRAAKRRRIDEYAVAAAYDVPISSRSSPGPIAGPSTSTSRPKSEPELLEPSSPDVQIISPTSATSTSASPTTTTASSSKLNASKPKPKKDEKEKEGEDEEDPSSGPQPELLSAYICPICFSPPTNATLTPCGHVCCGECLFTAVRASLQRAAATAAPEFVARCPVCRAALRGWDGRGGGVIGLKPRTMLSL